MVNFYKSYIKNKKRVLKSLRFTQTLKENVSKTLFYDLKL